MATVYEMKRCQNLFCFKLLLAITLEFLINVPVRLLILANFSHQYALIWPSTFIKFDDFIRFMSNFLSQKMLNENIFDPFIEDFEKTVDPPKINRGNK